MITGVHTMFYSSKPEELRAFFRDKFGFSSFDAGEGWLIFNLPPADLGVHPADEAHGAPSGLPHISFRCDEIERTVAELKSRGVEFSKSIEDQGWGFVTHFKVPGDFEVMLYQPKYSK